MDALIILGYLGAVAVGFTLGLIGGGGSILTVPILVYLMDISPVLATGYSLFVVGASAAVGAVRYMASGLASYRIALIFVVPSLITVFLTRHYLLPSIPENVLSIGFADITTDVLFFAMLVVTIIITAVLVLRANLGARGAFGKVMLLMMPAVVMVYVMRQFVIPALPHEMVTIKGLLLTKNTCIMLFFSVVMALAGISMIRRRDVADAAPLSGRRIHKPLVMAEGALVGTVTGIVGAGGGFLIVPALVILAHLPMKLAVGTSLLIIATNSLAGFLGDVSHQDIDWPLLLLFTSLAAAGIFAGHYTSGFFQSGQLKKIFGWFVVTMSVVILIIEVLAL